jgi:hypothetical protein
MWNPEVTYEIDNEDGARITCTTLASLDKIVKKVRTDFSEEIKNEEIMLPFEFIIGSLFPSSYDAIKDVMTQQYIEGYNKGYEEGKNDET